jgi:hypothetical protein
MSWSGNWRSPGDANSCCNTTETKRRRRVISTRASYSGGPGFKFRLPWLFFCGFPVPPGECWDSILKLGHDRFFPNPFSLPESGVGLVSKRGCLLTLAYYAFPRWYEFGERRWNDIDRGKPKNCEKNLSQCHSVHHKSHMDWPVREPGPPRWETGD